ncbi:condensation domain-containing protein, partial [Kibdelosporangium lantanae]
LSYAQRRLWFLNRLDGPSSAYNIPSVLRLTGELDVPALKAALNDVVERHESLRTVLTEDTQVVLPPTEVPFEIVETTDLRIHAEYEFDLTTEIPIRVTLVKAEDEHVLLVLLHHIASDEWSVGPLFTDLRHAYEQRLRGYAPQWKALPVQYADYAIWQQNLNVTGQVEYWRNQLAGAPEELTLPTDRPRPPKASDHGGYHFYELPPDVHDAVSALARANDVTVFMVVQAAVAVLLTKMGAGEDIPIGSPIAGRSEAALEDLVGFFVNTLVLRIRTNGDPTFTDLLHRVRETDLAAFEHADVPFERLVEVLSPTRSLARNPLFQVMVTHQHDLDLDLSVGGLASQAIPYGLDKAKFDLTFNFFSTATTAVTATTVGSLGTAAGSLGTAAT